MARSDEVLRFWFGTTDLEANIEPRGEWFKKDAAFDASIVRAFGPDIEKALNGELDAWRNSAASCLALVVLLDQFPRNVFRGAAKAFAGDPLALKHTLHALEQGFDREVAPVARWFFYLPLEHAESMDRQDEAVNRFRALGADTPGRDMVVDYALKHREVVQKFGRFPGRNQALGRESTPEERAYLEAGGGF